MFKGIVIPHTWTPASFLDRTFILQHELYTSILIDQHMKFSCWLILENNLAYIAWEIYTLTLNVAEAAYEVVDQNLIYAL